MLKTILVSFFIGAASLVNAQDLTDTEYEAFLGDIVLVQSIVGICNHPIDPIYNAILERAYSDALSALGIIRSNEIIKISMDAFTAGVIKFGTEDFCPFSMRQANTTFDKVLFRNVP